MFLNIEPQKKESKKNKKKYTLCKSNLDRILKGRKNNYVPEIKKKSYGIIDYKFIECQFYRNFDCLIIKYMIISIPIIENTKTGKSESILSFALTSLPDTYAKYMIKAI